MHHITFSIIIPVYNEEENICILHDALREVFTSLSGHYEILWVNDGSTDKSLEILSELKHRSSTNRIIHFSQNHGQTAALAAGFSKAQGDILITLDADLQNDPRDIPGMLEQLPEYDMVAGWRFERHDTFIRRISSRIANSVRNRFTWDNIMDTGCSLKVYKKECLQNIKLFNGMHRFLPTLIRNEGYSVIQYKVRHHPRLHGTSKYGIGNRLWRGIYDLIAVRWMLKRSLRYKNDMKEL